MFFVGISSSSSSSTECLNLNRVIVHFAFNCFFLNWSDHDRWGAFYSNWYLPLIKIHIHTPVLSCSRVFVVCSKVKGRNMKNYCTHVPMLFFTWCSHQVHISYVVVIQTSLRNTIYTSGNTKDDDNNNNNNNNTV